MSPIRSVSTADRRFPLAAGEGIDAVHTNPVYSYAVTCLEADGLVGEGSAFTLGDGNDVVTTLAGRLAAKMLECGGRDIEELMARFGVVQKALADDPQLRWLGPHKGAIHLALASVTNAAFDLWAKERGLPLWELLLSLADEELVDLLDFSWVEDVCDRKRALELLGAARTSRSQRLAILDRGYPGYDTSVGWFDYPDSELAANARRAAKAGFVAMKLKVGSKNLARDLRRVQIVREAVGPEAWLMVDANQKWTWPMAEKACLGLAELSVYWIEEPTHPDDVLGHQRLAKLVNPKGVRIAAGEHISHRVLFKNFMQAHAAQVIQVDALRVAGVSEFLVVSLMASCLGLEVVPHVGDMGQIHRHLVLFNHIGLDLPPTLLEYIPHLSDHFVHPARIQQGVYLTPREPGAGLALKTDKEMA